MNNYMYKVISTARHKEYFATRKEAEKYVKAMKKIGSLAEFRIYEVSNDNQ